MSVCGLLEKDGGDETSDQLQLALCTTGVASPDLAGLQAILHASAGRGNRDKQRRSADQAGARVPRARTWQVDQTGRILGPLERGEDSLACAEQMSFRRPVLGRDFFMPLGLRRSVGRVRGWARRRAADRSQP